MAHMIQRSKITGKAEMAYVGDAPWHGLGQALTPGASIETWQEESGLNWEALEAEVKFTPEGCTTPHTMPSRKVIYRSDTFAPIGDVSSRYQLLQPRAVLEFFRDQVEQGDWMIETAGVLKGGSKVWAMAKSHIEGIVHKCDPVRGRLLLATSMDGSMRTIAKYIETRVVCQNTMSMALSEGGDEVTTRHSSVFDALFAKESLGLCVEAHDRFMLAAEQMANTPVSNEFAVEFLRGLFGKPTLKDIKPEHDDYEFQRIMASINKTADQKMREQRSVTRCLELFNGEGMGSGLPGSIGTAWGLLNGVTQHIDHELGRSVDTRIESAWFGRGDDIKRQAYELLTAEE